MTARVVETWALDSDGGFVSNADDSVYSPSDVVTVLNTLTARVDALLVDNETESDRLIAARLDVSHVTRERDEAVAERDNLRQWCKDASEAAGRGADLFDEAVALLRKFDTLTRHPYYAPVPDMPGLDANYEAARTFLSRLHAKGGAL